MVLCLQYGEEGAFYSSGSLNVFMLLEQNFWWYMEEKQILAFGSNFFAGATESFIYGP